MLKSSSPSSSALIAAAEKREGTKAGRSKVKARQPQRWRHHRHFAGIKLISTAGEEAQESSSSCCLCSFFVVSNCEVTEAQREDRWVCLFSVIEAKSSLKTHCCTEIIKITRRRRDEQQTAESSSSSSSSSPSCSFSSPSAPSSSPLLRCSLLLFFFNLTP